MNAIGRLIGNRSAVLILAFCSAEAAGGGEIPKALRPTNPLKVYSLVELETEDDR
jgi:hypothetical protein